ncbi:MAG: ATP-dependent DNA ligase, partial [Mesorhizobium sp.]
KAEWLKPGLVGHVKFLKGEEMLRHAKLLDYREKE